MVSRHLNCVIKLVYFRCGSQEEAGLASETFAAVAGVLPERSVIVQLQQHRIAPSNFFRRFLRTRINDYDDGSMIVLDSRFDNGEQINRLGTVVNNYCQGRGSGRRDDRCCRQPAFCMIVISVVQVSTSVFDKCIDKVNSVVFSIGIVLHLGCYEVENGGGRVVRRAHDVDVYLRSSSKT